MVTQRRLPAAEMSENDAIEGAKNGENECFEFLYGLHKSHVYSLCRRMVGNVDAAEDLTQEAFLQMYRKIASFRGEAAFSSWLHRITVNTVLMQFRKKNLLDHFLLETPESTEEGMLPTDYGSEDQVLAGSIDRVTLNRAIQSLPRGYHIVLVLHDVEGYEHNEIARMIGCSIGNSRSQLHKARTKLRGLLLFTRPPRAELRGRESGRV